jgi:hypothetical protein
MGINNKDVTAGHTILDDIQNFKNGLDNVYEGNFNKYYKSGGKHSLLLEEIYKCSPKMTAIVFYASISPGKVMVYTNYVVMEGIDMLKVYFRLVGFNDYTKSKTGLGYCEYHGRIDKNVRIAVKNMYNGKDNIRGEKCKVIMLSPSATEGIQLLNVRQEHILEPHWNEVRITQVIGRGIRQCSHRELPMNERIVNVYRYKVHKPDTRHKDDTESLTADQIVEDGAKAKDNLIQSFLSAMREAATDCVLFKNHNMLRQSYQCFGFPEETLIGKSIGPAYKPELKEDLKYNYGLNAGNTMIKRVKVIAINAVYDNHAEKSKPVKYWYYAETGMVYDYIMHYPVGKIKTVDGIPNKLNNDTYIISDIIQIPDVKSI